MYPLCAVVSFLLFFFFSSRRRHTRLVSDWSSDVCSSDLLRQPRTAGHDQRWTQLRPAWPGGLCNQSTLVRGGIPGRQQLPQLLRGFGRVLCALPLPFATVNRGRSHRDFPHGWVAAVYCAIDL